MGPRRTSILCFLPGAWRWWETNLRFSLLVCGIFEKWVECQHLLFVELALRIRGGGGGASQVTLVVKNPPANAREARNLSSIPGWGRSPGEGIGNLLQYSCLENSTDRGAWQAIVHGVEESDMSECMCVYTHTCRESDMTACTCTRVRTRIQALGHCGVGVDKPT